MSSLHPQFPVIIALILCFSTIHSLISPLRSLRPRINFISWPVKAFPVLWKSKSDLTQINMQRETPAIMTLNREEFQQTLPLIALLVPTKLCSSYLQKFDRYLFKRPRMKRVYNIPESYSSQIALNTPSTTPMKVILLSDKLTSVSFQENSSDTSESALPKELIDFHRLTCQQHHIPSPYYLHYPFQLTYDDFSTEEVLHRLLSPVVSEVPTSFETIGHIAHMNLRDEVLPYRFLIGQVLLDKNPILRLVVNKVGTIETQFRTFPLEVIARRGHESNMKSPPEKGSHVTAEDNNTDFIVELRESNALFRFNFAEVYWNSRLQYEHQRIIEKIRFRAINRSRPSLFSSNPVSPLIVADMMAGVGPFAVPLAMTSVNSSDFVSPTVDSNNRKGVTTTSKGKGKKISPVMVYANDLNPISYHYLVENQAINKCQSQLTAFNLDGREFMKKMVGELQILPDEVIMNLPAIATDFLDVFIGLYATSNDDNVTQKEGIKLPRIHVYAFSTHPTDPVQDIVERVATVLQCQPDLIRESEGFEGHIVRDVAPKKVMICLSFTLPLEVAIRQRNSKDNNDDKDQIELNVATTTSSSSKKRFREEDNTI